jgi:hypothetical protein
MCSAIMIGRSPVWNEAAGGRYHRCDTTLKLCHRAWNATPNAKTTCTVEADGLGRDVALTSAISGSTLNFPVAAKRTLWPRLFVPTELWPETPRALPGPMTSPQCAGCDTTFENQTRLERTYSNSSQNHLLEQPTTVNKLLPLLCLLFRKTLDLALPKQSKPATTGPLAACEGVVVRTLHCQCWSLSVKQKIRPYSLCLSRFPHSKLQTSKSKTPGQRANQSLAMYTQISTPPRVRKVGEKHALGLTFQTETSIKPPFLQNLGPVHERFLSNEGHDVDLKGAISFNREKRLSKYEAMVQRTAGGHSQLEANDTPRRKRRRSASSSTVEDSDEQKQAHDEQGLAFYRQFRRRAEYHSKQLGLAAGVVSANSGNTKEVPSTTPPSSESSTRPPTIFSNKIGGSLASIDASDSITLSKWAIQMLAERSDLDS